MTTRRVSHVALRVRDLGRLREFYVSVLGATGGASHQNCRTGFRSGFVAFADGIGIELMTKAARAEAGPPAGGLGYAHIALCVGSRAAVDETVGRLRAPGVRGVGEPRVTGDGSSEAVVVHPEGNPIELVAEPEPAAECERAWTH